MILHEVFDTFLARPKGFLSFLFLPEWLHFTSYAGYPKAVSVWAEIPIALAKRENLPLSASLRARRDPELDRERAPPTQDKLSH